MPDIVIVIPTKFDVYCNFLSDVSCNQNDYIKKIASNDLMKDVKIVDSSSFLVEKARVELENGNFLYDSRDTHFNRLGNKYLSQFLALVIEKD